MKLTKDYTQIFRGKVHLYYSHKGKAFRHNLKIAEKDIKNKDNILIINTKVEKLKKLIYDYNLLNNVNPPVEYIKEKFFISEINKTDILEIFDTFIKEIESNTKKQSSEPYRNLKQNINDFLIKFNYTNLDEKFIDDFINFLYSKNYTYGIDTIRKKSVYFKSFVKYLQKNKIINFEPSYKKQEKKSFNKNVEILSNEELKYLINERTKNTKYKAILDMFLFQCFTSLRYSDLVQISKNKINNDLIHLVSIKTNADIYIYLNTLLKEILKDNNFDFSKISYLSYRLQLREMLKEYAEKIETLKEEKSIPKQIAKETIYITKKRYELIGTHTGRRVFITFQIRLNTSFPDIMRMTGHKSLELLQEYLDIYKQEKANETENLSNKMLDEILKPKK